MSNSAEDVAVDGAAAERKTGRSVSDASSSLKISSTQAVLQSSKLGMLGGVYVPTMNSIFGVVVFLRWGFAVGHAGVGHVLLMLLLGGAVSSFTTVSVSGLSTNETVKAGGAYYMISRAIGIEFGGALGVLFFISQTLGIGFYTLGCMETVYNVIESYGLSFNQMGLSFLIHAFTFIISLAGSVFFSRISSAILVGIVLALMLALLSYWSRPAGSSAGFLGMSASNFVDNFGPSYQEQFSFLSIFGIVYPSMTAILTGANMSGSLAEPGHAIPVGTALSVLTMMISYLLVVISVASGTRRDVLQSNFFVLQDQCWWPPLVLIGTLCATFSSALSGLVSTAKVLQAMSMDNLFPGIHVFQKVNKKGEPTRAIIATTLLSGCTLLLGDVNSIAPLLTNFVLITFAGLNLACMALHVTRSPNFRPTYKGSSWKTGFIGMLLCLVVMFLINPIFGAISVIIAVVIGTFLYLKPPPVSHWGRISQALLLRFVQSYLLKLDNRKTHVRFWRPTVLGLFSEIDKNNELIDMGQYIRKTGIYTISHVFVTDTRSSEAFQLYKDIQLRAAEVIVDESEMRTFVEVIPAENCASGALSLMLMSGMGALKSNLVFFGHPKWPVTSLSFDDPRLFSGDLSMSTGTGVTAIAESELSAAKRARLIDWMDMIFYAHNYGRHVVIATNSHKFNVPILLLAARQHLEGHHGIPRKPNRLVSLFKGSQAQRKPFIDVWVTADIEHHGALTAVLSVCQIASLFHMNREFRQDCALRVNLLIDFSDAGIRSAVAGKMVMLLKSCRIDAIVNVVSITDDVQSKNASTNQAALVSLDPNGASDHQNPLPPVSEIAPEAYIRRGSHSSAIAGVVSPTATTVATMGSKYAIRMFISCTRISHTSETASCWIFPSLSSSRLP
jgi:potassium/chloride transporter 9